MPQDRPAPWEGVHLPAGVYRWGVLLATLLGVVLRLAHIARPFNRLMAWNEGHYAMIALNFNRYGLWSQHNELGIDRTFSPGGPWLIWASMKLFGPTEMAARLPIALAGVAAIPLVAALARRLTRSEQIALTACIFTAIAPGLVYFAQNVQLDTLSLCCALAAAVHMLRYRDARASRGLVLEGGDARASRGRVDALAAGLWLTAAIWIKFTAMLLYPAFLLMWWPARPTRFRIAAAAAAGFAALTSLPSLAWIAVGLLHYNPSSVFTKRFFFRDWDIRGIVKALSEIPLAVEAHLFAVIFLLLLVGLPAAIRWRSRLRLIGVWSVPWVVQYLLAPWDSLVNRYYDLPATYLLTIVAAIGLWSWAARREAGAAGPAPFRTLAAALIVVAGFTVAYDAWDPMTDRIARAAMAHVPPIDPAPFYSARIVAALPDGRTIVDTPQTMFYAGGDPKWIDITGGDVRWKIDAEEYDYIVLNDYGHGQEPYYLVDGPLRTELTTHRYVEIAPAAWAHARTRVADLGGYRDPGMPFWLPAWRQPGIPIPR